MSIFVGNLPHDVTEEQLRELFLQEGEVLSAKIAVDKETGASLGYGFVRMLEGTKAHRAVGELNGVEFHGAAIAVRLARKGSERRGHDRRRNTRGSGRWLGKERRSGQDRRGDGDRRGPGERRRMHQQMHHMVAEGVFSEESDDV